MNDLRNTFGTTPVDPNEMDGLIPIHITRQAELNEWEQANIVDAQLWLKVKRPKITEILSQDFIKTLHKKMFDQTWGWAGHFRVTNKNIGADWSLISTLLKQLFDDVHFQLLQGAYSTDEMAVRFHHRLVFIHPFVNGNGRLSRIVTDQFLIAQEREFFSWGMLNFTDIDSLRRQYIKALQAADKHDYSLLLDFVRT